MVLILLRVLLMSLLLLLYFLLVSLPAIFVRLRTRLIVAALVHIAAFV